MTHDDSPSSCHIEVTSGEMVGQVSPKFGHTGPIVESILYMYMYVLSTYCSKDSSPNPDPRTYLTWAWNSKCLSLSSKTNCNKIEKFEPVSFEQ